MCRKGDVSFGLVVLLRASWLFCLSIFLCAHSILVHINPGQFTPRRGTSGFWLPWRIKSGSACCCCGAHHLAQEFYSLYFGIQFYSPQQTAHAQRYLENCGLRHRRPHHGVDQLLIHDCVCKCSATTWPLFPPMGEIPTRNGVGSCLCPPNASNTTSSSSSSSLSPSSSSPRKRTSSSRSSMVLFLPGASGALGNSCTLTSDKV